MNEAWLKALILGCTFGAVLLAVEVLASWVASSRVAGRAINLRLIPAANWANTTLCLKCSYDAETRMRFVASYAPGMRIVRRSGYVRGSAGLKGESVLNRNVPF